jgi:predicted AlkP superfamily pyrophosphatase or phosphodiesterase
MKRVCIINVVGLTPTLLQHAPALSALGAATPWASPWPAVTCTAQATLLTGLLPRQHGIVANGWYERQTGEVRFWQQSNHLIQGEKLYEGYETAKLFWWFNQGAPVRWYATPKPHYGCDGSKEFGIIDQTECRLEQRLGAFPFFSFWGPHAGLPSSQWIAAAAVEVLRQKSPQLTLVYLPHLDYDLQRFPVVDPQRVAEVDACAAAIIQQAHTQGVQVVVVSEYGLVPVSRPIMINQYLRKWGYLEVRDGPFGEMLQPLDSRAFAVVDHQLAHLYVARAADLPEVARRVREIPGIAEVVAPGELALDHPRSGDLIALAEPDAWFAYYYWLDQHRAPDFARTVDIHRKPGYDPCELFLTSKLRAAGRVLQKKLGFRYRMDVIPLDPTLVRGSHGLRPEPADGPLVIGPHAPQRMSEFKLYIQQLLADNV